MTLANKLTFFRLILAPVFFAIYTLHFILPEAYSAVWVVISLLIIFAISEITDILDGLAARRQKQDSDFGKFFDPFADTVMQLTCFLCFVIVGIMPGFLFLIAIYRELGIMFIRNLMQKKGITMGARVSGKVKTASFITASSLALLYSSILRLKDLELHLAFKNLLLASEPFFEIASLSVFYASVAISVFSFFDYLMVYRRNCKTP